MRPEVGRRSRGPGSSGSCLRSGTGASKGPLSAAWSPAAFRPQAHPPASVDTVSPGSRGISGLSTGTGETGGLALQPGPRVPVRTWAWGCGCTMLGLLEKLLPVYVTRIKSKLQGLENRSYLRKTSNLKTKSTATAPQGHCQCWGLTTGCGASLDMGCRAKKCPPAPGRPCSVLSPRSPPCFWARIGM